MEEKKIVPCRILICFDIRDEKGRSLLHQPNTVGFTVLRHLIKPEDAETVFSELKLLPSRLANKPKLRHLFYTNLHASTKENTQTDLPPLVLQTEEHLSHSLLYNTTDNRNPPFADKDAILIQGRFAKVLQFLRKIRSSAAFLVAGFRM